MMGNGRVMLSEAKHLCRDSCNGSQMLHFTQHDTVEKRGKTIGNPTVLPFRDTLLV